jgi:hypothetical protein
VFRRKNDAPQTVDSASERVDLPDAQQPKGRPTPSRKEAEAARKAALTGTTDPKSAKKADREARRQAQVEARAGLASGDENRLPARDRGPVKAFVRDRVDGRISAGEVFIPVAILVLVMGFVRIPWVQVALLYLWVIMLVAVVIDAGYTAFTLRRALPEKFPDADPRSSVGHDDRGRLVYGTKGAILYGILRSLQMRIMRLPKPKIRWNGTPVPPKAAKR